METYYRRTVTPRGRVRYEPVSVRDALSGDPLGHWLVRVYPGGREARPVDPEHVEVEAAIGDVRAAMVDAMADALEGRPTVELHRDRYGVTQETVDRAWDAWTAIVGDRPVRLIRPSVVGVVDRGLDVLRRRMRGEG